MLAAMAPPQYIQKVPTVYSLQQLHEEAPGLHASPDKPVSDVAGQLLPRISFPWGAGYAQKRVRSFGDMFGVVPDMDDNTASDDSDQDMVPSPAASTISGQPSLLDSVLLAEWEDRAEQGLFRYDVTACPTKLVPGPYGFIAQCNEGRASKKRPTEFRVDQVCQPWDPKKFNFTKALQKEVLFQFEPKPGSVAPEYLPAAPTSTSPNLVFINVSPIEYGHVLLVPRVLHDLNQLVDKESMRLALQFCHAADNPYFRLCYNSLGAYGTVNHLHFQAYYLQAPFAVERAPTLPILGWPGVKGAPHLRVMQLTEYPVNGLVFESSVDVDAMADYVAGVCVRLQQANVPHNLFVADSGARVFLYPNAFAQAKAENRVPEDVLATQVDPAAFEISGHVIMKRQQDYEELTQDAIWRLLSLSSFTGKAWEDFKRLALNM
eukprot:jgi/Astpho2/828/Aster-00677